MNIKMPEQEVTRQDRRQDRYVVIDNYWRGCLDGLVALFCCRILIG